MNDDEVRIRARLHDYADAIEPTRDLPAAGRARYRRRLRRRRATAVLSGALAVIAVVGIGVGVARRSDHTLKLRTGHSSPATSAPVLSTTIVPTTLSPGPVVSGEALADVTWISTDEGWALVATDLVHTTDGGTTWRSVSQLPDIKVPFDGVDSDACAAIACVDHVRFADARHGYLFGRAFLTTDDGGVTWTREQADAVVALEVLHGRAFRVVSAHDCITVGCSYSVETATVGSTTWRRLATPELIGDGAQLLYDGPRIYLAAYGNFAGSEPRVKLIRSLDGGTSWQLRPDPCAATSAQRIATSALAAAPGGFLVALCQPLDGRVPSVRSSFDAGTTFGPLLPLPLAQGAIVESIAAGSPTSIVVTAMDGNQQAAWVSHDDGATASWHSTLSVSASDAPISIEFLGFEDAQTGRVAMSPNHLWTTRDGGETWTWSSYP
jgi:photosystem II stability/assembly factor-like uncharacterized protein